MAKYDPKRPRPQVDQEDSAPVEALLEAADNVGDKAKAQTVAATAGEPTVDLRGAGQESEGTSVQGRRPKVKGVAFAGDHSEDFEARSDVPVVPPPEEGTANRAVLSVLAGAALFGLVLSVFVWRRRRKA